MAYIEIVYETRSWRSKVTACLSAPDIPNESSQMLKLYLQFQEAVLPYVVICLTT